MGSVCAEQQQQHHKFHHSHQLNLKHKILREIDIPPRRQQQQLLSRRFLDSSDLFIDSDDSLFHKFLPSNNLDGDSDDDDSDPYSSDHFRMFEFKVRKCTRSRSHDWTDCPFAHPGEKARRRDPRRYHYSGTVCPEFRRGTCARGEKCEFSHGVFECWLHPSRYRTEACKDGKNCKRKICFFAHTPRQLRVLPANCNETTIPSSSLLNLNSPASASAYFEMKNKNINPPCCVFCHSVAAASADSPTSTLMGMSHMSPPLSPSPPRSPAKPAARFSPVSRYKEKFSNMDPGGIFHQFNSAAMIYNDAVNELKNSMEAMQLNLQEPTSPVTWIDVNFNGGEDQYPNQFIMSPSNLSPAAGGGTSKFSGGGGGSGFFSTKTFFEEPENNSLAGPDLGWVNDLLT